jgi:drug/metabolite transporter (DMT)-like permease
MSQGSTDRYQDPAAARAAVVLTAVTVVWGSTFVLSQSLVSVIPVSSFLFWRFAIATAALVAIHPTAALRLPRRDQRRAGVAGIALASGFALQSVGLQHTSATTSGFITGLFVVLTPLVSAGLFRERIPPRVWWGVWLAVAGLAALSLRGWAVGAGDAVTLAGALAFAMQIALLARWTTRENAYGIAVIEMGVIALTGLALTSVDGGVRVPATVEAWAGLAFLGVVASAVAFTVQAWAQSHLSATRTAVIMTAETLWAGLTGVLIAHDSVTARLLVGGVLILAAMYVVELGGRVHSSRWSIPLSGTLTQSGRLLSS